MNPADPNQERNADQHEPEGRNLDDLYEAELEQQAAALTQHLLEIDRGELRPEVLQNLMRAAHSIKGAARIANRRAAARVSHQMEECFVLAQHGTITLTREDIDVLLKAVDFLMEHKGGIKREQEDRVSLQLSGRLADLERIASRSSGKNAVIQPGAEALTEAQLPALQPTKAESLHPAIPEDRYLRLASASLKRLFGLANETLMEAQWLQPFSESLEQLRLRQNEIAKGIEKLRYGLGGEALANSHRTQLKKLSSDIAEAQRSFALRLQELETFDQRATQVSRRLYMEVLRTRMRPLHDLFGGMPRMVRDLSRVLGKQVRLEITGGGTQVDREVLERIEAPLIHLLRNAIDHGCELPEIRRSAGKPDEAVVRIDARHSGGMLLLTVSDDGAGIDSTRLRERIENRGLANAGLLSRLGDKELLDYLFLPGFTMRTSATEISGRGVGLDLVHTAVRNLHGTVRVLNRPGHGMEFHLHLPLTISVIRALLLEVAGEPYALGLGRVSAVAKVQAAGITSIQGIPHITNGGRHVALADARQLLGISAEPEFGAEMNVIILGDREPRYALIVDKFLGERELIVQPLDPRLGKVRDISGAALIGDGKPLLVIDVDEAIRSLDRLALQGRLAYDIEAKPSGGFLPGYAAPPSS